MGIPLKYITLIFLWTICSVVEAKLSNTMFDIRHIGYTEGLSSQRVFSIIEDAEGVMWIATKGGVDRYNGQDVKNYTLPGDFHYGDMAGRRLRLLYDERYGLWAYDHTGRIYRYSIKNDSFEQNLFLGQFISGEIILNKLCFDNKGNLWFGLGEGLYKKDVNGNISAVVPKQYVNDIVSSGEKLFVGTSKGVLQLSNSALKDDAQWLIEDKDVQTLFYDLYKDELWIGTFNNGLWVMNLKTSDLRTLSSKNSDFLYPIRAITSYDSHTILIGIDGGGVYTVDKNTKESHLLVRTEDDTDLFLRGNGIYSITKDSQGNIWIGSYSGGVSVAILSRYPIALLVHERGNQQSLINNNVNNIAENINGNLWFATDDGISIRNEALKTWSHQLKGNVVVALCRGEDGYMWAGTYGDGIFHLDNNGRVVRHITKQGGVLTTNNIFSIKQDPDGDLWVGGLDGHLLVINKKGEYVSSYDIKWVHSFELIDSDRMAVATVNGFCVVNKRTGEVKRYATFQEFQDKNVSAYIISMLFNDDDTVWLGTEGGGLNLYNMNTGEVKTLTSRDGLPSDDIYSLQRDSRGRLWVSTGKGLALIDSFKVSNLNYIGDIAKEYNKSSFASISDGRFAYGSTNGVVSVTPNSITTTNYEAPLRFTGFTVEYSNEEEEKRLRPVICDMLTNGVVQLDYNHNSFDVAFESINYRFQRDIAYQYILEGYEKSWSDLSSNGAVHYTKVSPGSYLLKIRSLRRSNGEVISEKMLVINISEPWWNSWWAWTLYICIAGIVFYFILRFNSNRLQKRYDEDKIRFFTDTAHDIRTPVTLIMAPLEDLGNEKGLSEKGLHLLNVARNNTSKLHTLVTQLLEFEKVDTHRQPVLAPVNLNELFLEEIAVFEPLCIKKQLHLNLSLPDENVYIMADRYMIEIVLDNLVSNACKYTMLQGSIDISLSCTKRKVIIEIKDSGIGIPKKSWKHLFTDVHRAENARKSQEGGTGFGLMQVYRIINILQGKITFQSEVNKGTTFTITFKRSDVVPELEPQEVDIPQKSLQIEPVPVEVDNSVRTDQDEKATLLIVEDHETLRHYLQKTFEDEYRVIAVSDGQEALNYLSNEYPDLILSDVMMPGIQGSDLCKMVKDNPDTASIPFILLTAKVTHEATVEGLRKGADDYIPKPFSTEILRLKVQGFIANRNRQRAFLMKQVYNQVEGNSQSVNIDCDSENFKTNTCDSEVDFSANDLSESDRLFVTRSTQLVIDNISNTSFDINSLCQEMAMSRTLFYSRLKSLTGKGPQEFIRIIRLQKAAELLTEGRSVMDVSVDTGFVNVKYFSSIFKKHFGVQPSKYNQADSE